MDDNLSQMRTLSAQQEEAFAREAETTRRIRQDEPLPWNEDDLDMTAGGQGYTKVLNEWVKREEVEATPFGSRLHEIYDADMRGPMGFFEAVSPLPGGARSVAEYLPYVNMMDTAETVFGMFDVDKKLKRYLAGDKTLSLADKVQVQAYFAAQNRADQATLWGKVGQIAPSAISMAQEYYIHGRLKAWAGAKIGAAVTGTPHGAVAGSIAGFIAGTGSLTKKALDNTRFTRYVSKVLNTQYRGLMSQAARRLHAATPGLTDDLLAEATARQVAQNMFKAAGTKGAKGLSRQAQMLIDVGLDEKRMTRMLLDGASFAARQAKDPNVASRWSKAIWHGAKSHGWQALSMSNIAEDMVDPTIRQQLGRALGYFMTRMPLFGIERGLMNEGVDALTRLAVDGTGHNASAMAIRIGAVMENRPEVERHAAWLSFGSRVVEHMSEEFGRALGDIVPDSLKYVATRAPGAKTGRKLLESTRDSLAQHTQMGRYIRDLFEVARGTQDDFVARASTLVSKVGDKGVRGFRDVFNRGRMDVTRNALAAENVPVLGYILAKKAVEKGWSLDATAKMFFDLGYDGILEEMAEERVGAFLSGYFGLDGRAVEESVIPSLAEGLVAGWESLEDFDQLKAEAIAFSLPLFARMSVVKLQSSIGAGTLDQARRAAEAMEIHQSAISGRASIEENGRTRAGKRFNPPKGMEPLYARFRNNVEAGHLVQLDSRVVAEGIVNSAEHLTDFNTGGTMLAKTARSVLGVMGFMATGQVDMLRSNPHRYAAASVMHRMGPLMDAAYDVRQRLTHEALVEAQQAAQAEIAAGRSVEFPTELDEAARARVKERTIEWTRNAYLFVSAKDGAVVSSRNEMLDTFRQIFNTSGQGKILSEGDAEVFEFTSGKHKGEKLTADQVVEKYFGSLNQLAALNKATLRKSVGRGVEVEVDIDALEDTLTDPFMTAAFFQLKKANGLVALDLGKGKTAEDIKAEMTLITGNSIDISRLAPSVTLLASRERSRKDFTEAEQEAVANIAQALFSANLSTSDSMDRVREAAVNMSRVLLASYMVPRSVLAAKGGTKLGTIRMVSREGAYIYEATRPDNTLAFFNTEDAAHEFLATVNNVRVPTVYKAQQSVHVLPYDRFKLVPGTELTTPFRGYMSGLIRQTFVDTDGAESVIESEFDTFSDEAGELRVRARRIWMQRLQDHTTLAERLYRYGLKEHKAFRGSAVTLDEGKFEKVLAQNSDLTIEQLKRFNAMAEHLAERALKLQANGASVDMSAPGGVYSAEVAFNAFSGKENGNVYVSMSSLGNPWGFAEDHIEGAAKNPDSTNFYLKLVEGVNEEAPLWEWASFIQPFFRGLADKAEAKRATAESLGQREDVALWDTIISWRSPLEGVGTRMHFNYAKAIEAVSHLTNVLLLHNVSGASTGLYGKLNELANELRDLPSYPAFAKSMALVLATHHGERGLNFDTDNNTLATKVQPIVATLSMNPELADVHKALGDYMNSRVTLSDGSMPAQSPTKTASLTDYGRTNWEGAKVLLGLSDRMPQGSVIKDAVDEAMIETMTTREEVRRALTVKASPDEEGYEAAQRERTNRQVATLVAAIGAKLDRRSPDPRVVDDVVEEMDRRAGVRAGRVINSDNAKEADPDEESNGPRDKYSDDAMSLFALDNTRYLHNVLQAVITDGSLRTASRSEVVGYLRNISADLKLAFSPQVAGRVHPLFTGRKGYNAWVAGLGRQAEQAVDPTQAAALTALSAYFEAVSYEAGRKTMSVLSDFTAAGGLKISGSGVHIRATDVPFSNPADVLVESMSRRPVLKRRVLTKDRRKQLLELDQLTSVKGTDIAAYEQNSFFAKRKDRMKSLYDKVATDKTVANLIREGSKAKQDQRVPSTGRYKNEVPSETFMAKVDFVKEGLAMAAEMADVAFGNAAGPMVEVFRDPLTAFNMADRLTLDQLRDLLYLDQEVYAGRLARHIANAAAHYYASGEAGEGTAEARARLRDALTFVDIAPTQLNPKTVVSQKDRASAIPFVLSFAAPRHMADDTSRKAEGDSPQRRIALAGSRLPAAMRLVADTKLRGVAEAMSQLVWGDASHVEEDLENLDRFLVYPDGTPVYSKFIDYQDGEMVRGDSATAKELIQWLQDLHTNNTDAYVRVLLNPTDKSSWYVLNVPRAVFMGDGMAGSRLRPEGADLAKSYAARHALIQSMFGMGKMDEKRSSMWTGVGSDIVLPSENGVQVGVVVMPDGTVHEFLKGGEVIGYHDVELLRDVAKGETDFGPGGAPGFKLMFSDYGRSAQFDKGRVTTAEPDAVSAVPFVNDLRKEATKLAEETRSLVSLMDNDAYKLGPLLASYVSIDGKSLPEYLAQEGKSLEDEVTLTYGRTAEVDNHAEGSTETGKLSELMPMLAVRDATVAGLSVKIVTVRSDTMLVRHAAMVEHSSEESPSHLARNKLSDIDVTTHVMLQVMALNRVAAEAREDAIIELMTSPDQIARVVRLLREQDEAASSEVADLLEEGQILATDPAVLTKLASAVLHRIASGAMEIRTSHPLEPNAQTVLTTKDPVTGSPVLAFSDDNTSVLLDGPATPGVEPPRVIQGPLAEFMRGARKALVLARGLVNNRTPEYRYDLSLRDTFGKGLSDRDKADAVARVLSRLFTLSAKDPNSLAVVEYYRDFVAPMFNDYDGKPLKRVVSFHDILTPEGYKHFFTDKRALPGTRHEDLRPLFNYTMFAFEEDGHGRGGRDGKFAVLGHIHSDLRVPSGIDEARGFATASSPATMVPFKKGDAYRTYEPMTLTLDELKGEVGERAATTLDKALAALGSDTSSAGALAVISNWLDHGGQALLRRNYGADGISMTMRNRKPVLSFWAEVMPEEGTLVPAASAGIVQHALVTGIEGTDMDGDSTGVAVVPSSHHGLVPVLPGLTPENARLIADYGKRNTRDIRNTASSAIELEVGLRANWEDFKAIYNHGLERHTALVHGGQDYDAVYLAPDLDKGWPGLNSFIISPAAIAPGNLDIAGSKIELDLRDPAALGTNVDAAVDAAQSRGVAVSWNNVFSTAYADGLPFFLADTNGDPIEVGQLAVDKDGKSYQFEGQLLFSVDRGFSTSRADKLSQVFAKMQATKYANMFFDAVKNGTPARMNLTMEFVPLFISMIYSRQWARHMSGQPFDVWLAEANREGVAFQRAFMQWATEVMGEMEVEAKAQAKKGRALKLNLIDFLNARKGTPARSTMRGPVTVYQDLMRRNTEFRGHFALSRLSYAQGHNIHEANKLARALEQAKPLTGDEMAAQRAVLGQLDQLYSRAPDYVRSPLVRYADYVVEESGRTVSASTRRQISSVGYRMSAAAHAARLLRARDKRVRDIARTAITQGDTTELMRQIENILALFQARERLLVTLDKETHPVMNEFLTALRRPFFDAEGNVSGEGRVRMRFGSHLSRDLKEAAARFDRDDETPLRDAFDRWQSREGGLFGWNEVADTMLPEEYREAVANLTPRDLLTLLYLYGALTEDAAGPVPRPGAFTWAFPPAYHQGLSKFRTALLEGYANEELEGYLVREAELKSYEHPKFLRSGTVVNIPSVRGTSLEGLAAKLDTYDFAKGRPLPVSREEIGREAVDRMRGFAQLSQAEARQQVTALQLRGVHVLGFPVDRLRTTEEFGEAVGTSAVDTLARMILQRVNSFSPRDAILLAKDQDLEDVLGEEGIRSALRLAFGDAPVPHNLFLYAGYMPPAPQAVTHSLVEVAQEPVVETPLATVAPAPVAPTTTTTTTGFLGYKGGFDGKGKGTPAGDGKDKAMRAVADSAIVELVSDRPSSSKTTIDQLGPVDENSSIVMLARNGKLRGEPLRPETVDTIRDLVSNLPGVRFVVGEMPGVDSQFIDLLRKLGASFEVYHTGSSPRISIPVTPTTPATPPASATVEVVKLGSREKVPDGVVSGMRHGLANMNNVPASAYGQQDSGWLGNPYYWTGNAQGKPVDNVRVFATVQGATGAFRKDFLAKVESDAAFRQAVLDLRDKGMKLGYYRPEGEGQSGLHHLQVVQEWLAGQPVEAPGGEAEAPTAPTANAISEFRGVNRFLSNFWPAPLDYEGVRYPTSEHAYQAAKTLDPEARARIAALPTAADAKREGKKVEMRPDWDQVKDQVMLDIVRAKFQQNPELAAKLRATGSVDLVEGNTWGDTYWGVSGGVGRNQLGKTLMAVREALVPDALPTAFSSVSTDLRPVDIELHRDGDTWTLSKGAETITESREAMIRRYRDVATGFADKAALRAGIQGLTVQQIHEALKTRGQKSPAILLLSALTSRNMPKFQGQEWPEGFAAESPAWSGISRRGAEGARTRKEAGVLEAMDQVVRAVKLVSGNEALQSEIDGLAEAAGKWIAELSPAEGMDSRALRALGLAVSAMSETLDPESVAAYQRISQFLASAALGSPAHSATDRQLWNLMKVDGLSPLGWISQGTNPQERFARALVFSSPDGQAHDIGAASAKALDIAKAIAGGPLVQSPEAPLSDIPADTQSFLSVGSRGQAVRVERDPVVGWMVTEVDTSISEPILPQTAKHYWNKRTATTKADTSLDIPTLTASLVLSNATEIDVVARSMGRAAKLKDLVGNPQADFAKVAQYLEAWKKQEGIVYDPRDAWRRGEAFYHDIGAFNSEAPGLLGKIAGVLARQASLLKRGDSKWWENTKDQLLVSGYTSKSEKTASPKPSDFSVVTKFMFGHTPDDAETLVKGADGVWRTDFSESEPFTDTEAKKLFDTLWLPDTDVTTRPGYGARFVIRPKSSDIVWAAAHDVYSGTVTTKAIISSGPVEPATFKTSEEMLRYLDEKLPALASKMRAENFKSPAYMAQLTEGSVTYTIDRPWNQAAGDHTYTLSSRVSKTSVSAAPKAPSARNLQSIADSIEAAIAGRKSKYNELGLRLRLGNFYIEPGNAPLPPVVENLNQILKNAYLLHNGSLDALGSTEQASSVPMPPTASIAPRSVSPEGEVSLAFSWHDALVAIPARVKAQQTLAQQLKRINAPKVEAEAFLKWAEGKDGDSAELLAQYEAEVLPKLEIVGARVWPEGHEHDIAPSSAYENLSVNKGQGEYKEYFIRTPFPVPGQHGEFQDPNLAGWFRVREYRGVEDNQVVYQGRELPRMETNAFGQTWYGATLPNGESVLVNTLEQDSVGGAHHTAGGIYAWAVVPRKMFDDILAKRLSPSAIPESLWKDRGAEASPMFVGAVRRADEDPLAGGTLEIQEIQSELFQKNKGGFREQVGETLPDDVEPFEEGGRYLNEYTFSNEQATFLNLMLKDQTWVPVFVNAIKQWARNQGFTKVRFPTGETAARVEGHQVLADRLTALQEERAWWIEGARRSASELHRIDEFTRKLDDGTSIFYSRNPAGVWGFRFADETRAQNDDLSEEKVLSALAHPTAQVLRSRDLEAVDADINELKTQGIEKLAPIEAFYEKRVASIVNRMGALPVTDANGNTWREVNLARSLDAGVLTASLPYQFSDPRWEQFSVDGFNYRFNKGEGQLERAVEGSASWAKVDMAFYNDAIAKADPSITEDIVSPASAPDVQRVGDDPELLASLLANEQVPEGFVDPDDAPAPAQVTVLPPKPPALTVPELRTLRYKLRELGVFEEFWGTPGGSVDTGSSYGVASARDIVAGSPEAQEYAKLKTNPVLLRQGTEILQALADHFGVQDLFHPRVVAAAIQLFKHSSVDAGLLGKFAPPAEERGGNLGLRDLTGLASLAVNRMVGDLQSLDTDRLSPRFYDPAPGDASGFHQAGRARSKLPQWAAMHPTDDLLSSGVTGSEILALFDAVNIALLELRKRAAQSPDVTPDDVNPEGDDYDTPDLPDLPTSADIYEPLNKTYRAHITPYSTWIQESVLPTLGIANLRELATDGTSEAALLGTRQKIAYLRRFWGMGQSGAIPVLMEAQAPTFVTDPSRPGEISDETRTVSSVERTGFGIKGLSFTDDERILTAWVASTALADASGSNVVLTGAEADFSDTPNTKNGRNAVDWRAVPTSELPSGAPTFNVNKMLEKAKASLPVEVYEAWLGAFDDVTRVALNNFSHDPATMKDTKPVEFNRHVLRALAKAKLVSVSEGNGLNTSSATLTVPVDMVEKIFKSSSARDKLMKAGRKESELSVKQLSKAVREVIKEAEKAIYDNRGWLGNAFGRSVSGLGGLAPFISGHGAYRRFFEYADESPKSYEEAVLSTQRSLEATIAKENERPEAERRGAYEASPRMKAYIASLYGVTFQQIDEALRGNPDLTIDGVREMVRQMRSAAQHRGQARYKDIDVNLLAYTDVAHALAYKAIEVINRNVSDPAAKRDNLADAAAALAAAREVARSQNTSVNFSHREMWENFGILPEGRHDIFSSTLAWSDRIATTMRWREAFVAMLAAKDSNGDHVLVAVPNMEVQDAADMLPDELWGALAKSWAQSLAKKGLKGPAYDPAKTGQENAKIIADSYTAIASGSRNRMGRVRRGVQDDYRVIEVGGAAPVSRMYARRDTDEDSSPLLNSMVGGTAAGYATRMLHTLGMQDIHPALRAAQAAVGWTRMSNMAFSGFFAFATGGESMIAASGLSGVLGNAAPRAFRRRAARGGRSLASLPLIGAIMGDDIKNMTATARDFMPLLRSNDPQIVELRQIAHALGISTGQDAMAKIFDTGSAHGDMERVALHIRKTMGRAAEKAFRKTSRIAFEAIPEATFEYLLEATTLAALHNFTERMRAEAEARGKIFEPREHMQKAARYIQAEFGPIDHAVYPWLTPKGYAAASTIFMSLQWTMGALEAAGAGTILHKITGHEFAPEVRKFMLWRWARMLSVVIYGLPALAQVLARGMGLALGVDDDDEGKWFMWNNEVGRRTHADITPFLLGLGKLPGNKFLQDLPVVGKFVPGYRDEQTTGRRRYYMRWGKQGYEVGTLLVEGDATRYFIGKLSSPASGMLEHAFGRNLAMDWELPFKDQNVVSSLFHGSDGFKDSATVNYLKKILPFSFAGALSGPVDNEAGILSALGPVSKGVNTKTLTAMMEDRLRKWADRGSPEARHLRVPLGHLVSDLARMGYDNGYDGVKIAKQASVNVANRYYQDVFANAPGNPSGKVDLDRMGEALDALARLSRGLDGISRSMQNRDSQLNKLPGVETWRQRRQAIDTAFRRDKRRSTKWDPRDFNQAALGGNVSDALDTDTLPEKILGYAVAHPSQLTPEDHQYFQDNPQAGGYFEQSLDPRGASTVSSPTDFLDSDELPETVLGYPVLRPEALTDEDLEYFRDYPAAAGFFDPEPQPTGE